MTFTEPPAPAPETAEDSPERAEAAAPPRPSAAGGRGGGGDNMADLEDVTLDGKELQKLRVTDLKAALEERGLAKSGSKNALIKRLKGALMLEQLQKHSASHAGIQPNSQIGEEMSSNSFIKQYLAKQHELLRQRLEREARGALEPEEAESDSEGTDALTAATQQTDALPGSELQELQDSYASSLHSEDKEESQEERSEDYDSGPTQQDSSLVTTRASRAQKVEEGGNHPSEEEEDEEEEVEELVPAPCGGRQKPPAPADQPPPSSPPRDHRRAAPPAKLKRTPQPPRNNPGTGASSLAQAEGAAEERPAERRRWSAGRERRRPPSADSPPPSAGQGQEPLANASGHRADPVPNAAQSRRPRQVTLTPQGCGPQSGLLTDQGTTGRPPDHTAQAHRGEPGGGAGTTSVSTNPDSRRTISAWPDPDN
ncbi:uncharacterized protein [Scyliorhinus torazame]|uniref:uncharacterized protein n=1 Tax=Scyliorhinus torazame TaxID=75743 RepID=UPI003B5BC942